MNCKRIYKNGLLSLITILLISIMSLNVVTATTLEQVSELDKFNVILSRDGVDKEVEVYGNVFTTYFKADDLDGLVKDREFVSIKDIDGVIIEHYPNHYIIKKKPEKVVNVFDWYINQNNTGVHSYNNCGPTVTAMIAKWKDENTSIRVEKLRNVTKSSGSWWSTDDIVFHLNNENIDNNIKEYRDEESITSELDKGNLIIACVDVSYLGYPGSGHFLIIHDYVEKDGEVEYITHDPNGEDVNISFSSSGRNRRYKGKKMDKAIVSWWKNIIVVKNPS